jgi:four helix bundle protein
VRHYRELVAWQKAMDLVVLVYKVTEEYPRKEMFGLTNQTRRAAVSVPSNIAEGQGRQTSREFANFLAIARGSLQELETQTLLGKRLKFVSEHQASEVLSLADEVSRILRGLSRSLAR